NPLARSGKGCTQAASSPPGNIPRPYERRDSNDRLAFTPRSACLQKHARLYYWTYGGPSHGKRVPARAEELPEKPQSARDGPVRGSRAPFRSSVDPLLGKAARGER